MKKRLLCLSVLLGGMILSSVSTVSASEMQYDSSSEAQYDLFTGYSEDEKVLELPNGGYLIGEAELVDATSFNELTQDYDIVYESYNSKTDPNAITVSEAKEDILEELANNENAVEPRHGGSNIPDITKNTIILKNNGSYSSTNFYGSGWQFSRYAFLSESSTGDYLLWSAIIDSGVVGSANQAIETKQASDQGIIQAQGTAVYPGAPQYVTRGRNPMIFYSYNPAANSQFKVENR